MGMQLTAIKTLLLIVLLLDLCFDAVSTVEKENRAQSRGDFFRYPINHANGRALSCAKGRRSLTCNRAARLGWCKGNDPAFGLRDAKLCSCEQATQRVLCREPPFYSSTAYSGDVVIGEKNSDTRLHGELAKRAAQWLDMNLEPMPRRKSKVGFGQCHRRRGEQHQ